MRCPEPQAWIAFYGGEGDETLAGHLEGCPRCQDEFDRLCRLGAGIRGALAAPPRPRARRRRFSPRASAPWLPLAVAAGLMVAALGLVLIPRKQPPPVQAPIARAPEVPVVEPPVEPPPPPKEPTPVEAPTTVSVEEPIPPPPPPEPVVPRPTVAAVAVATLERVEGDVTIGDAAARESRQLLAGEGLAAHAGGRAVVRFSDGTRMELGERTTLARIDDRAGKRVDLTEGTLAIEAARQPADRAMMIVTPQGEARIVGTTLRLAVGKGATRLEVVEGKVLLARPGAGAVEVIGGYSAVAAADVELAARPLPGTVCEVLHRYDFEDGRLPRPFKGGSVERGPGDRSCAAVTRGASGGAVHLTDDGKGLFAYSEDLVLSFDYWVDRAVKTLDVQSWTRTQQLTFGTTLWNPPQERWTHAVIPLADFVRGELRVKPNELVGTLWIQPGQVGGKLYVDNLEIVRVSRVEKR